MDMTNAERLEYEMADSFRERHLRQVSSSVSLLSCPWRAYSGDSHS
jgi:hypothetical protein